jgi:hypothetical protein
MSDLSITKHDYTKTPWLAKVALPVPVFLSSTGLKKQMECAFAENSWNGTLVASAHKVSCRRLGFRNVPFGLSFLCPHGPSHHTARTKILERSPYRNVQQLDCLCDCIANVTAWPYSLKRDLHLHICVEHAVVAPRTKRHKPRSGTTIGYGHRRPSDEQPSTLIPTMELDPDRTCLPVSAETEMK